MSQPAMTPVKARPLYHRLLRLHHLRMRGAVTFALFEGSIGVSVLLALAEFINWWGVAAIPVTVAAMVKLHDVVVGSVVRPLAFANLGTPRLAGGAIVGRSPVPRPSQPTAVIVADDAVADPAARPETPPTARGRASSVARGVAPVPAKDEPQAPRPAPRARRPERQVRSASAPAAEFAEGAPNNRRGRFNKGRFTS